MNIYLISLVDTNLSEKMTLLSGIAGIRSAFYYNEYGRIFSLSKKLVESFIQFIKRTAFFPDSKILNFYRRGMELDYEPEHPVAEHDPLSLPLHRFVHHLSFDPDTEYQIFPVHLHYTTAAELRMLTGMGIMNDGMVSRVVLHELGIPKQKINFGPQRLHYLQQVVESYEPGADDSLEKLMRHFQVSESRFRQDCKEFFGCTFIQFYSKMKLMYVLDDLFFSRLNLKEIAYRNGFSGYNAMYKAFNRNYGIRIADIPRFSYAL